MDYILCPAAKWHVDVANNGRRRRLEDLAVSHTDAYRFVAVEAGAVDLDFLAGVEPADRQRLKPSLPVPFLFPIH